MSVVVGLVVLGFVLAGCGGVSRERAVTGEASRPSDSGAERPPAPTAPEPPKLADQLARIAGELSDLQNMVAKLIVSSREQADQLHHLQRRVGELETQSRTRMPSAPSGFAPPAPAPPPPAPAQPPPARAAREPPLGSTPATTAEELYRAGLERLRVKEFDAAVLVLYDLISSYPDHPLRERAQFLVADTLYQQRDYRGALAEFEALVDASPKGSRVPDALLKIGLCQRSLGDTARARQTWERLVRDYPGSTAARQARVLLKG